jgi:hypothetical protein
MKKQDIPSSHEEFAVEFGDINGTKVYELPFSSKRKHKKTSEINKKPD